MSMYVCMYLYMYVSMYVGVEMFKKTLDYGGAGDNVGCLLRTVKREDVQRGQVRPT